MSACINTILSIMVIVIMLYELTQARDAFNQCERVGLGLIGGGILMRTSIWWTAHSPFDDWAAGVTLLGMFMYFGGRAYRNHRHAVGNARQLRIAKEHFRNQGK